MKKTRDDDFEIDFPVIIETNMDDISGEVIGKVIDDLSSNKYIEDVFAWPIIMKKGRPGICLRVITWNTKISDVIPLIITKTGTLGVKIIPFKRVKVKREIRTITININGSPEKVRVKIGFLKDKIVTYKAEFGDIVALSKKYNIPYIRLLREVYNQLRASIQNYESNQ